MRIQLRYAMIAMMVLATLASSVAEAQWVLLARRAVGRVQQMSQQSGENQGAGYDTAAVILEAPPDKVYAAVLRSVENRPDVTITRQDASARVVQVTKGKQIAGIQVTMVGDNLTHLLVTSARVGAQPNAAELVTNTVLRACRDMNVECTSAGPN